MKDNRAGHSPNAIKLRITKNKKDGLDKSVHLRHRRITKKITSQKF